MSTTRLNQTDFARKLGIERQAVHKAIKKGLLIRHGTGRAAYIDLEHPLTVAYMKNGSVNRHRPKSTKPRAKPKPRVPQAEPENPAPPSPERLESERIYQDKAATEHLKKLKEIEKLDLNNRRVRNELIERDLVELFINKTYEIDNGQLKPLGFKIASDVAAAFGIEDEKQIRKACKMIDDEVLSILKQVKREQNRFLKKIGAEKISEKGKAA